MAGTYTLRVRDASFTPVGEVDDFSDLDVVARFNVAGSWALTLPASSSMASALEEPGSGIIVIRDGLTLLSGPVTQRQRQWSRDADQFVVAGPDDTVWLERRLAYPVATGPPYSASTYDTRTGAAETVMRAYVNVNAGPGATTARRVPTLTLAADLARGSTVTANARFDVLGDLLRSLALPGGGLGFRVLQVGTGLQFQVYAPADRTTTAVFSPDLGNLAAFDYSAAAAESNYVIAGGTGEGTARTFAEAGDSASILRDGRIESFKDSRDTSDPTVLNQAITDELAQRASKTNLSISPVDTPAVAFGTSYTVGDRVTVVVDGTAIQDVVREVRLQVQASGEQITPTVGSPGATSTDVLGLFDRLSNVGRRLSKLERR